MNEIPKAKSKKQKILLVEGGGMRGAFSGGALAAMCKYYPAKNFDLALGVSAGSCSLAYYITEDTDKLISKKNILKIWSEELHSHKFISFRELLKLKRIMKREYLVDYIIKEKYKLILETLSKKPFFITVTNLKTAMPEYIRATKENFFDLLRSAISLPVATKGFNFFDNRFFSDGGIIDPIPLKAVIESGYKDITLVLNHPRDYISEPVSKFLSKLSFPKNPLLQKILQYSHHKEYNEAKHLIQNPPADIKLKIIDPKEKIPVGILTTKKEKIIQLMNHGWSVAEKEFQNFKQ